MRDGDNSEYQNQVNDAFQKLGLSTEASPTEIKKQYRELALQSHPDKNPDDQDAGKKFIELKYAYDIALAYSASAHGSKNSTSNRPSTKTLREQYQLPTFEKLLEKLSKSKNEQDALYYAQINRHLCKDSLQIEKVFKHLNSESKVSFLVCKRDPSGMIEVFENFSWIWSSTLVFLLKQIDPSRHIYVLQTYQKVIQQSFDSFLFTYNDIELEEVKKTFFFDNVNWLLNTLKMSPAEIFSQIKLSAEEKNKFFLSYYKVKTLNDLRSSIELLESKEDKTFLVAARLEKLLQNMSLQDETPASFASNLSFLEINQIKYYLNKYGATFRDKHTVLFELLDHLKDKPENQFTVANYFQDIIDTNGVKTKVFQQLQGLAVKRNFMASKTLVTLIDKEYPQEASDDPNFNFVTSLREKIIASDTIEQICQLFKFAPEPLNNSQRNIFALFKQNPSTKYRNFLEQGISILKDYDLLLDPPTSASTSALTVTVDKG